MVPEVIWATAEAQQARLTATSRMQRLPVKHPPPGHLIHSCARMRSAVALHLQPNATNRVQNKKQEDNKGRVQLRAFTTAQYLVPITATLQSEPGRTSKRAGLGPYRCGHGQRCPCRPPQRPHPYPSASRLQGEVTALKGRHWLKLGACCADEVRAHHCKTFAVMDTARCCLCPPWVCGTPPSAWR